MDATDRFGCTPLHTACISAAQATLQKDTRILDSSLEFIMALIDHGADLNLQTGERYDYKGKNKFIIMKESNRNVSDFYLNSCLLFIQMKKKNKNIDKDKITYNKIFFIDIRSTKKEMKLFVLCFLLLTVYSFT